MAGAGAQGAGAAPSWGGVGGGGGEFRRVSVPGDKGTDQVWYTIQPPGRAGPTVVFFGGDSCVDIAHQSEDPDTILRLSDPEQVVPLLSSRFGAKEVFFVGPTRVDERVWACFDNFVEGTKSGEPARGYRRDGRAGERLEAVLEAARRDAHRACTSPQEPNHAGGARGDGRSTVLVGFSKGGVVVNQILAEMARPGGGAPLGVTDAHFLDVGLNCRGAYLTDPSVLGDLARNHPGVRVHLHGTPRQWGNQRPWIAQEKDRMVALLREAGIRHGQRTYMQGEAPSLAMHFRVLDEFAPDLCS